MIRPMTSMGYTVHDMILTPGNGDQQSASVTHMNPCDPPSVGVEVYMMKEIVGFRRLETHGKLKVFELQKTLISMLTRQNHVDMLRQIKTYCNTQWCDHVGRMQVH